MPPAKLSKAEVVRRGREIYARILRSRLEPQHDGQFVAIEVDSGDYEVADEALDAARELSLRHPDAVPFIHRVGYPAAYKLGGRFLVGRRP